MAGCAQTDDRTMTWPRPLCIHAFDRSNQYKTFSFRSSHGAILPRMTRGAKKKEEKHGNFRPSDDGDSVTSHRY